MSELKSSAKPFDISKREVWEAYEQVKANNGAPGVDRVTLGEFEKDLRGSLYKIWNRMSSGSYFPPPVAAVAIPKPHGQGTRMLGIPTVADRVAQTVVARRLEGKVEPIFHPDSYGYRPKRSALDAVGTCRRRCWKYDWVIDLDVQKFFDSVAWDLVIKAVQAHTDDPWVVLYVKRWLAAPLQHPDGTLQERDRGTPQGSAVSPVLANLFLHYAFDVWIAREFPGVQFERYCDDAVVHCVSERQARVVLDAIAERLAYCRLELHAGKTHIVYCKDSNRHGSHEHEQFGFLGYTFRPRLARSKVGDLFVSFSPAVSDEAAKAVRRTIKRWRLHRWSEATLTDLAGSINGIVQGWANYYGRFYPSEFARSLRLINDYLVRWAMWKYKRLRRHPARAARFLASVARREPDLFAHWRLGLRPDGWAMGAR